MELNLKIHGNYYRGANKARNSLYGELSIISISLEDGMFIGENRRLNMCTHNLKMCDFYFYEFH